MLTLLRMQRAARRHDPRATTTDTGGGVRALSLTIDGHELLFALDYGQESGLSWVIATDGETRETIGEIESPEYPVTTDAEGTMLDVIGWVRSDFGRAELPD